MQKGYICTFYNFFSRGNKLNISGKNLKIHITYIDMLDWASFVHNNVFIELKQQFVKM